MAWTAYTPTLTQSATVTKTLNYAKYARSGNTVFVQLAMTVTGAGTGANAVLIGLPVAAANAASLACWGVGTIYDASANLAYKGVAVVSSSTAASIWASSTSVNALGVADFTAALAVGDIVDLSIMYEAA